MGKSKRELFRLPRMQKFLNSMCDESMGFGEWKGFAIELLGHIIQILEDHHLTYCLISGTLLGQARHNDFIPWDDDIDLLVERRLLEFLPEIREQHLGKYDFICADWLTYVKVSSRYGSAIPDNRGRKFDYCLEKEVEFSWPFVDLYLYDTTDQGDLRFFHKDWAPCHFFPVRYVSFLGLRVPIPHNPHYFLSENFGPDYMTNFVQKMYSHRRELWTK